jgi:hypothetical protein
MSSLTHEDVLAVVGPVDDVAAAELIGTGATSAELTQAHAWVRASPANDERERPTGRIAEVIEILEQIDMSARASPWPEDTNVTEPRA